MGYQITTPFSEQYHDTVEHLLQQTESKLQACVRRVTQVGKTQFFEQLGETQAVKLLTRHGDTPRVDAKHQRRAVFVNDYAVSELVDPQDAEKMLIDPKSPILQSFVFALNREKDREIITAATGTAFADIGGGNGAVSAVPLPASQQIPVDYVHTGPSVNSGLTLSKLIEAKSILESEEQMPGAKAYLVVHRKQIDDMLRYVDQVSNADYANIKALVAGTVDDFMGFTWIKSPLVQYDPASNINTCFAFMENGLLLSTTKDIETKVSERADKNYAWQGYARLSVGATRMQEKTVVSIACDRNP